MNNLIFTIYFDIEDSELELEEYEKNAYTKKQLRYYQPHLTLNKISYSKSTQSDFIMFDDVEDLNEFSKKFDSDTPTYTIINFYKLHLLDILADEYDNILYLDQDVYINTTKNIFNELDMTNISVWHEDVKDQLIEYTNFYKERQLYSRSYLNKCISSYATSFAFDWPVNYNKYNTGIILSSKDNIKKLNIKDNLNFLVDNYKKIMYNKDIPSSITSKFVLNNEALFANIVSKERVNVSNLEKEWHHILNHESVKENFTDTNSCLYHFINKRFDWLQVS